MSLQNQSAPMTASRRRYRLGFFWPVVFIALGVVLLLNNINVLPGNAWDWVWRLWPVALIAMGFDSVVRREFVGATLIIVMGGLLLAINFGYLKLNIWEVIIRLWPLFLISAGLSLIFDHRWLHGLGSAIGVIVILVILAGSISFVSTGSQAISWQMGQPVPGQKVNQPLNGAKTANLRIEPTTGVLNVTALAESSALFDGTINLTGDERLIQNGQMEGTTANYLLGSDGTYVGFGSSSSQWKRWDLRLAPELPMSLAVKMAMGETNLDLSSLQISNLNVDMAVGATTMTLPRDASMIAKVSNAIGTLNIVVPPGTAIRIIHNGALSTIYVPSGYVQSGRAYSSPNYESSSHRIDLSVSQAIGALSLHEQSGR